MTIGMRRIPLKQYKYLTFLSMLFITVFVICDTTVYRMVSIFGNELPLSGFIIPIVFTIGDIIAEAYGYRITMKVLLNGIICQCLFGILISVALFAPSPIGNSLNHSYDQTFQHILRANFCSCFSVTSGMFANAFLISKLKIYMNGKRFWIRTIISSGASEMVLCTVAYLILFTGMKDIYEVIRIIYSVWIYKMLFSICMAPVASVIGRLLKKSEYTDVYDIEISYNPFKRSQNYVVEFDENTNKLQDAFYQDWLSEKQSRISKSKCILKNKSRCIVGKVYALVGSKQTSNDKVVFGL